MALPLTPDAKIHIEPTPNPNTLRFVLESPWMNGAAVDFPDVQSAAEAPLAQRLFGLEGVTGVMLGANFVSVSANEVDWRPFADQVIEAIREHLGSGEPVILESAIKSIDLSSKSETEQGIIRMINEEIQPALAMDGGGCVYCGFENGIVYLELRGACHGCPHAVMTLKMGIERRLHEQFPEVVAVETVQ